MILINEIKCNVCGTHIKTNTGYKLTYCECGAVAVDGGDAYVRILGYKENWDYVEEEKGE